MSNRRSAPESRASDGGFFLRPFILVCVPIRKPPKAAGSGSRRYGLAEFHVAPNPDLGPPTGQDRLILLLAARAAILQNRREIHLGSASSILKTLAMPPDGRNYQRLARRFARVLGARMTATYWQKTGGETRVLRRSEIYFDRARLWFDRPDPLANRSRFENELTLSEGFWDEIHRNPAFVDMTVVQSLSNSPGSLAFYLWLCLASHTAWPDHVTHIPFHGPLGLKRRLGVTGYNQNRDFVRMVRRWLQSVQAVWRGCPALISSDETGLNVRNTIPELPNEAAGDC